MKKEKPDTESEEANVKSEDAPVVYSMFDKFEKALEMDAKGTPRSTIYTELDVSSATFYKWIKNPQYWKDQYVAKPDRLKRTTKEIVASLKKKENSLETVRSLLSDLNLNEYELEFMYHYIEKRNTTEALLRTLPPNVQMSRKAVKMKAFKLAQRKQIRAGIDRILQWEMEGIHMSLGTDIIGQLYRMAFYDPAMFIDIVDGVPQSRFKTMDDVPEEYRCCVLGFKSSWHPKDPNKILVDIQLADRKAAMHELMEYSNMYEDNNKGLKTIGEGLNKMAALMAKNGLDTIPGELEMKDVTPVKDVADANA